MNERIRELVKQAWDERDLVTPTRALDDAFTDKFAELIVLECCKVLEHTHHDTISRQSAAEFLRKHFGIIKDNYERRI